MTTYISRHPCHAEGCPIEVPRRMFMCREHWSMVPLHLKREVLEAYVPGQESGAVRPSKAYLEAARAAINYVKGRGPRMVPKREPEEP